MEGQKINVVIASVTSNYVNLSEKMKKMMV